MDVREKLVDILDNIYLPMMSGSTTIGEYRIPHKFNEEIADHLITNGVTVQEWISVDDRLPKDWTDVLVSSRFDFLETAVYTGTPGKWRVCWNGDMLEADSITHWMPLPRPPKGE